MVPEPDQVFANARIWIQIIYLIMFFDNFNEERGLKLWAVIEKLEFAYGPVFSRESNPDNTLDRIRVLSDVRIRIRLITTWIRIR